MIIGSLKRLQAAVKEEAAPRKYKKKRMSELSDSSLRKIARDQSDPRHAMAQRELKHRSAVNRRNAKQGQNSKSTAPIKKII